MLQPYAYYPLDQPTPANVRISPHQIPAHMPPSPVVILGLEALDTEIENDPWLAAFAPLTLIAAGGFVAVTYLQSRESTGDLDYLLEPQWAQDDDIKKPLREVMNKVGSQMKFNEEWINEDLALFVTKESRVSLFEEAQKQNIILWQGRNLLVLAAPMEWALERKLRRIHAADRGRKSELDLGDALAMLKHLKDRNKGLQLDREYIRGLNVNSFDVIPDSATMDFVAAAYREKFNEEIFK